MTKYDRLSEQIANIFAEVSQEYKKSNEDDIKIPTFSDNDITHFSENEGRSKSSQKDANSSNVNDDFPAKLQKV